MSLDRLSPKNTIIASSSSYLLISKISENVIHKDRCINAHPALPPHVVPFVEICEEVQTHLLELLKKHYLYIKRLIMQL